MSNVVYGTINLTNIITGAIHAVGGSGADWRVQAAGAGLLVVVGVVGGIFSYRWIKRRDKK